MIKLKVIDPDPDHHQSLTFVTSEYFKPLQKNHKKIRRKYFELSATLRFAMVKKIRQKCLDPQRDPNQI